MPAVQNGKSKIKMVALMPHNQKNITWHSFISLNKKPSMEIINGMILRFKSTEAVKRVQVYQFYENKVLIHEIKRP
ncbi:hypothetical protein [Flavobacterium degerlachei]|jgi:hypothetical protein|uniref:Uncharacterized protein n=1 Tax=Flavobacterium degerlachei TaxID=229203 RepID=A0A1H3B2A0_9FLAO|nr:hypothetical protein [Flavobacterium degerlachei]SDX35935.1 hypothetical protein SAMN05444338_109133 [Flavobacterium degerlachei]